MRISNHSGFQVESAITIHQHTKARPHLLSLVLCSLEFRWWKRPTVCNNWNCYPIYPIERFSSPKTCERLTVKYHLHRVNRWKFRVDLHVYVQWSNELDGAESWTWLSGMTEKYSSAGWPVDVADRRQCPQRRRVSADRASHRWEPGSRGRNAP